MRFVARAVSLAGSAALVACSTFSSEPGPGDAGAADGASSSASSGGSSGGTSSGGTSASSGGVAADGAVAALPDGAQCSPFSAPCGEGSYCDSPTCDAGFCQRKAKAFDNGYLPRCGCDGITYFNVTLAIEAGVSTFTSNPCDATSFPDTKKCTRGGGECPVGTTCVVHTVSNATCSKIDGVCWVLPATCPMTPTTGECGTNDCVPICDVMKADTPYYPRIGCQ